MCVQAANYITSIGTSGVAFTSYLGIDRIHELHTVSVYVENYSAKRSSAFVCYYIFTAAIMHVATRASMSSCLVCTADY